MDQQQNAVEQIHSSVLNRKEKQRPAAKPSFAAKLFGYDIFISFALGPPPRGTHSYTSDLARRLRELDYTVFFSEDEAPVGNQLDSTLQKALRRSHALVVVANREMLEDPRWVRTEVEEFRKTHPRRPVITIFIDAPLQDPALAQKVRGWLPYEGNIWVDESADAVRDGVASDIAVNRLATAPKFRKASRWWRLTVAVAMIILLSLSIGLGIATMRAIENQQRAVRASVEAERNLSKAQQATLEAQRNEQLAEKATLEAKASQRKAELATENALQSRNRAEIARRQELALRINAEGQALLTGARYGGINLGLLKLLAAHQIAPHIEIESAIGDQAIRLMHMVKIIDTEATAIAFSPDGSRFLTGGSGGQLRLWDTQSGQLLKRGGDSINGTIRSLAFSSDGSRIASGGESRLVLWDTQIKKLIGDGLKQQYRHRGNVQSVAFSPDGSRLLTGSGEGTIGLWDARTGETDGRLMESHKGEVTSVAFSPDGSRLLSGGDDGILRLWDAESEKPVCISSKGHEGQVTSVAFSQDGVHLVSSSTDGTIRFWDAQTCQDVGEPLERDRGVKIQITVCSDGIHLVAGGWDGKLQVWDMRSKEPVGPTVQAHRGIFSSLACSQDGKWLLSAGWEDGTVRLWDIKSWYPPGTMLEGAKEFPKIDSGRILGLSLDRTRILHINHVDKNWELLKHNDQKWALRLSNATTGQPIGAPLRTHIDERVLNGALSPNGAKVVSGDQDGMLRIWDAQSGEPIGKPFESDQAQITRVAFSPDGTRFVSSSVDGTLRLWDAQTAQPIGIPATGHKGRVSNIVFSPDGTRLFSAGTDETLRLWDIKARQPCGALLPDQSEHTQVVFSPDGTHLLSLSYPFYPMSLWLWNAKSCKPIGKLIDGVKIATFSPDGTRFVSAGKDGTLQFWDVRSGKPIGTPLKSPKKLGGGGSDSLTFSPDGKYLISSSYGALQFWDIQSRSLISRSIEHDETWGEGVYFFEDFIAFSHDARLIRLNSAQGALHPLPAPKAWPEFLCAKLTRNMSRQEWREHVSPDIDYIEQCPGLPIPPDESNKQLITHRGNNVKK